MLHKKQGVRIINNLRDVIYQFRLESFTIALTRARISPSNDEPNQGQRRHHHHRGRDPQGPSEGHEHPLPHPEALRSRSQSCQNIGCA